MALFFGWDQELGRLLVQQYLLGDQETFDSRLKLSTK